MQNVQSTLFTKIIKRGIALFLMLLLVLGQPVASVSVAATEIAPNAEPTRYCDDDLFAETDGSGAVSASYQVHYDELVIEENITYLSAPSLGNNETDLVNTCAPVTGTNVVCFYDRWYPELIPNYDPGLLFANGNYFYYSDRALQPTRTLLRTLHSLMGSATNGTTSAEFRNGLSSYVQSVGRTLTIDSFYTSSQTVNLDMLKTAIQQNKVGVIMCSTYNFAMAVDNFTDEKLVNVVRVTSNVGHMMMVYGYKTFAYYRDGENFLTETYLYVSSGYSSGEDGYVVLENHITIDEAYIMTIS